MRGNGNWEVAVLPRTRDEVAPFYPHILWFGPGGAHSLAPAAQSKCGRPQRRSMMAHQRHPRLVIDRREHNGMLKRIGTGEELIAVLNCIECRPIKLRDPAQKKAVMEIVRREDVQSS